MHSVLCALPLWPYFIPIYIHNYIIIIYTYITARFFFHCDFRDYYHVRFPVSLCHFNARILLLCVVFDFNSK